MTTELTGTMEQSLQHASGALQDMADTVWDLSRDQKLEGGGVTLTADQLLELRMLLVKGSATAGRGATALSQITHYLAHGLNDSSVASGLTDW